MAVEDDRHWAAHYRLSATKARRWAKAAKTETMQRMLLKLASDYDALAAERERIANTK